MKRPCRVCSCPSWRMVLFLLLAATVLPAAVQAEFIGPIVTVNVTSQAGDATLSWTVPDPSPDGDSNQAVISIDESVSLKGGSGDFIAELSDLSVTLNGDPAVDLEFAVNAGAFDTTFTITSAVVDFDALTNPFAFASAAVTLTDRDPYPGNGGSLNVVAPHDGLYQATYNAGTGFADLVGSLSKSDAGSIAADSFTSLLTIAGDVTEIQSQFQFTVSANDSASGTSRFEVTPVPEPVTMHLLLAGWVGLLVWRRRRAA